MKYMTKEWFALTKKRERIWSEAMAKTDPNSPVEWRIDGSLRAKHDQAIREVDEKIRATMVDYSVARQRDFPTPPFFIDRLDQRHEATVTEIKEAGGTLSLTTVNPAELTPVTIRFIGATVRRNELRPAPPFPKWLYYEIYPLAGGHYELHVLLTQNSAPAELILECEDVLFE